MSADNYYIIRRHPLGGYAPVMGFASDFDEDDALLIPLASPTDLQFKTLSQALSWATEQFSEYGVDVHPECRPIPISKRFKNIFKR